MLGTLLPTKSSTREKNEPLGQGFTLIELLVVIAIISLLSSVVLASLGDVRERAQVTGLVENFQQIETAFLAWALNERRGVWWEEDDFLPPNGPGYPNLQFLIDNTRLGEYLPAAADPNFSRPLHYNKQGPAVISCTSGVRFGVAITTRTITSPDIAERIDQAIDGGDGSGCGRVQWTADTSADDIDLYYKFEPL